MLLIGKEGMCPEETVLEFKNRKRLISPFRKIKEMQNPNS